FVRTDMAASAASAERCSAGLARVVPRQGSLRHRSCSRDSRARLGRGWMDRESDGTPGAGHRAHWNDERRRNQPAAGLQHLAHGAARYRGEVIRIAMSYRLARRTRKYPIVSTNK